MHEASNVKQANKATQLTPSNRSASAALIWVLETGADGGLGLCAPRSTLLALSRNCGGGKWTYNPCKWSLTHTLPCAPTPCEQNAKSPFENGTTLDIEQRHLNASCSICQIYGAPQSRLTQKLCHFYTSDKLQAATHTALAPRRAGRVLRRQGALQIGFAAAALARRRPRWEEPRGLQHRPVLLHLLRLDPHRRLGGAELPFQLLVPDLQ